MVVVQKYTYLQRIIFENIRFVCHIGFLFMFKNLYKLCCNRVPNGVTAGGRLTTTSIPWSSCSRTEPRNRNPAPLTANRTGPESSHRPFLVTNGYTATNRGGRDEKTWLRAPVPKENVNFQTIKNMEFFFYYCYK